MLAERVVCYMALVTVSAFESSVRFFGRGDSFLRVMTSSMIIQLLRFFKSFIADSAHVLERVGEVVPHSALEDIHPAAYAALQRFYKWVLKTHRTTLNAWKKLDK